MNLSKRYAPVHQHHFKREKISCIIILAMILFTFNAFQYQGINQLVRTNNTDSALTGKNQLSNINTNSPKLSTSKINTAAPQHDNLSTLTPQSQGILETQEAGTFTKNQSASTPIDNSTATLISANLSSLKYDFHADTETNGTYTQDWQVPVDNNSGHAPGSVSIDTKNYVQGTASAHFIMNKTSSTWYTTFTEPTWNDSKLPSPFLYPTLLSGYFSFDATNLTTNPYGYITMLRFAFPGTSGLAYSAINVFMNISSGYSVPASGVQVDSICCVLGIYPGQNKSDSRVQVWQQKNSWYGFRINLTQILQDAYPVNSSLYASATQVFTNLTKTWIELQSQTQSSGVLHLWIDDLQWQTNLTKTYTKQWIITHPPFIKKNGSYLTNQSINILTNNVWNTAKNDWSVTTKNISISTNTVPAQSPYAPVWLFQRINVYIYNFTWNINIDNSTWWNACQSIIPGVYFVQNSMYQCNLNQSKDTALDILPSFFQTNTAIKSSINLIFAWQILHNSISLTPQNSTLSTSTAITSSTQFNPEYKLSLVNQNSIIQAAIQTDTTTTATTFTDWYAFQWTAALFSAGFKAFPIIKLYMQVPNLLNIEKYPVLSFTQQGLVVQLTLNLTLIGQYVPLVARIYNAYWVTTENYILGDNENLSIFLPWKQPMNPGDQIFLQMLINSSQYMGWYSTSFILGNNSLIATTQVPENTTAISLFNGDTFFFIIFYGICSIIGVTTVTLIRRSQKKHVAKDLFEE